MMVPAFDKLEGAPLLVVDVERPGVRSVVPVSIAELGCAGWQSGVAQIKQLKSP